MTASLLALTASNTTLFGIVAVLLIVALLFYLFRGRGL